VGQVLVEIEVEGAASLQPAVPEASTPAAVSAPPSAPVTTSASAAPRGASVGARAPGVLATPIVRALAAEKGVDLTKVTGSGAMGRVLKDDVLAAASGVGAAQPAAASAKSAAPTASPLVYRPAVRNLEDITVQITDGVGKGMVKSMTEALKMPIMALGEELDVTELIALQKALKPIAEKQYGSKVSMTAFFLKAISLALYEHPIINSKFKDGTPASYTKFGSHNISVAIDSKNGLMVPNIKDVGNLSVLDIQQEVLRLAGAAQANKLALSDITGGTITFSNVGTIGTKDPRPIPFDGQAVIGAAGRVMVLPRYNSKMELVPRQIMNVRWVGDHRHLDGATLARFSNSFKRLVENPGEWTLTMK
jgi:2-oxoisovalerate dehydrogenase E2 component (dihydrolipoyl transacylase)